MSQTTSNFELIRMNIVKQDLEIKNGFLLPDIFKQYALAWNSKILFPSDMKQFSYCLGAFMCVIIKLSKNLQVQATFKSIYDLTLPQLDQRLDLLEQLVNYIFDISGMDAIPTTPQFQQIPLKLFENFEFFKQTPDKLSNFYYYNNQLVSQPQEQTNYRLIIYIHQGGQTGIQFSTNLNPTQLYWTEFKSSIKLPTSFNSGSFNNNQQNLQTNINQNFPSKLINNTNNLGNQVVQSQIFKQPQNQYITPDNSSQFKQYPNQFSQQPNINQGKIYQPINDPQQNQNAQIRETPPIIQQNQIQDPQQQQVDQCEDQIDVMSTQFANNQIADKSAGESQRLQTTLNIKNNKIQQCEICWIDYDQNSEGILSRCCERKFHKLCYLNDLSQKADQYKNFDALSCYGCNKQLKEYKEFLKASLGQKLLPLITTEIIKNIPNNCFNCQLPIAINLQQTTKQMIKCMRCQTEICRLCKQAYHGENEQNKQCPSLHKEIIKSMAGMVITICPFCDLIQTKDDKCNHVTCSKCKNDLCAICSVDRRPILGHGNHFHREGCVDYMAWLDKNGKKGVDKKENKCKLCQETGRVCQYPKSLKEYKAEKQY